MQKINNLSFGRILLYIVITIWAVIALIPLFWLFVSALTPNSVMVKMPPAISFSNLSLENFIRLFGKDPDYNVYAPIGRWFLNTLLIASLVTIFNLFFDTLAGYTFAKRSFPGKNIIFWIILSTMMIPGQVILVPRFIMIMRMGLIDNYGAILYPSIAGVFGIFMMKQYIQTLPSNLEDAARIDGCSEFGIFWRIILPLTKPALAVLGILVFMGQWKNFVWPMVVINTTEKLLLEPGLATLQQQYTTDYGVLMAGAAFSAVPMILIFFFFQKYFIKGLTIGSVKG